MTSPIRIQRKRTAERIPITWAETRAAGNFSQPVELFGRRWWILESPIFRPFSNIAVVGAERVEQ